MSALAVCAPLDFGKELSLRDDIGVSNEIAGPRVGELQDCCCSCSDQAQGEGRWFVERLRGRIVDALVSTLAK
jgi:hypothetical protein